MSFKISYPGIIDIEPRAELSISGINGNAKATMLIENSQFTQGIEIEQNEFTIKNSNNTQTPLKIQSVSGEYWSFPPNAPQAGDLLRGTGVGNGSIAAPRETEWS